MGNLTLNTRSLDLSLNANRNITSFAYDSLELTGQGEDCFMYLPVPPAVSGHFDVEFYFYLEAGVFRCPISFNGSVSDTTMLQIYAVPGYFWAIDHVSSTGNIGAGSTSYLSDHAVQTWHKINLTWHNNVIKFYVNGNIAATVDCTGYTFNFHSTGCFLMGGSPSGPQNYPTYTIGTGKIKNISGAYQFGTAYTDIAQTAVASVNDDVASIVNKGFLGGNIIKTLYTGLERPTYSAATSITLKYPKLTLNPREYTGTPTPTPSAGDGAVFDDSVFDGGVFG